uniref:Uncharacterized protein n=1 Tax=Knipowitschia caucasica TaxID=637954 RepID=A0AAV2LX83_KNICA
MDSRYIMDKSRVSGVDYSFRTGRSVRSPPDRHGTVLYTFVLDSAAEGKGENLAAKGIGLSADGRLLHVVEKMSRREQHDAGLVEGLRMATPPHCPGLNGQVPRGLMHLDIRNPGAQAELQGQGSTPTERQPHSSHIPVPRNRYAHFLLLLSSATYGNNTVQTHSSKRL